MKIDNSINPVTTVSVNDGKRQVGATSNTSESQESSDSNVHISSDAAKLQSTSASDAVVDTARVEEIKQAISDGSFKVNPEIVADRLLETVKELIQSKKGES